jgi:hypothetical protein
LQYSNWHRSRMTCSSLPRFVDLINVPYYFSVPLKKITVYSAKKRSFMWKDCEISLWWKRTLSAHSIPLFWYRGSSRYIISKRVAVISVRFYDNRLVHRDENMLRRDVSVATTVTSLGSRLYSDYILKWANIINEVHPLQTLKRDCCNKSEFSPERIIPRLF